MSEKKKGFWSWLGFGKKEEAKQEEIQQEIIQPEEPVIIEPEAEKSFSEKLDELEDKIEEKADQLEDYVEEKEDQLEQKFEQVEEKFEQKVEDFKEFVEEKVEEVKEFFDDVEDKIEQTFEEEKGEQAVENLQNIAIEQLDLNEQEQVAYQVENAVAEEVATTELVNNVQDIVEEPTIQDEYQEKPSQGGFFSRLIQGLIKTKQNIGSGFRNFFSGKKIDDELFEELEELLLVADLGMPTTQKIINNLTQHATKKQLKDADLLYQQLKIELGEVLKPVAQPLVLEEKKPYVILMVGVNGVGKTTTIGKLARKFQNEGKSVMLAAGDTFRAAAVEQLQVWGERNNIPVVAQSTGSDSASVIFDAMQSAAAKGIDVLIADTAGRLQNKNNLMDELKKIVRVMKKYDETAPHEIMLTLDAGTGQNAISQAKLFNEAVGLTGITLTKLDGTAKGGVIFAIADQFNIPIRFIGVGEKIEDLRPFNAEEFIEALFSHEDEHND
ncbi:Cell division protein FtsY-like protein [Mannheimia sp. USDA-ARS-USMARC-1261]|uniref:signal recognition particle-docking protein FtsY n=1 Tax=Mannheimia sp. USDA-ARS-USMARC-1261 TaxID=1432056 RepID=UPI0003E3AA23|nr:signal recognition particle-docking protein FtsY [Mannheimia sp. USDA-ARS-USMARC-1261]AHG72786.1 Cell division protein FtsY-like protein [Mannheimia sp. USDA-ARS-USMARC-1261]